MPPLAKFTKEDIIDCSYKIVKKEGLDNLNARYIAKKLNSSVQPIFSNFENMEDLKNSLYNKIINEFYTFITKKIDDKLPEYKQIGLNYIKFAKEEPILFNILFMQNNIVDANDFIELYDSFSIIKTIIANQTNLEEKDIKSFHFKMWIYTHGIATLVAKNPEMFNYKQISDLLSQEYQALMLLEENKSNKWILKE